MRIKMITTMAGPTGCVPSGSTVDVETSVARDLIDGGYAMQVGVAELETATSGPAENAARRGAGATGQGRGRGRRRSEAAETETADTAPTANPPV